MTNYMSTMLLFLALCASFICLGHSKVDIGVCYGLIADNLPSPKEVVELYQTHGIKKMRIFQPYPHVLEAVRGSGIQLTVGTLNSHIPIIASSEEEAESWFKAHIEPYVTDVDIKYISVGNEVVPGQNSESILPAMHNLQKVLEKNNLDIKATTVVHAIVLGTSYPPSQGQFTQISQPFMSDIIKFLSSHKTPILVNLYPYFPYSLDESKTIDLDYALLSTSATPQEDGDLSYPTMLDAMIDAFYSAMEREGVTDVDIVVSESGWPHDGNGDFTTPELTQTYNTNFIQKVGSGVGTPKRPETKIEGFIFAMFDENQKEVGVERHWGLFNPSMEPNYDIVFDS